MNETLTILLVEDNPADAAIVGAQLLGADPGGHPPRLVTAATLSEAMTRIGEERFDCILLDLSLPDSDGLDTLITLHARAPLTPVVVLSGREDPVLWIDSVRIGAQDFLVKGRFTPQILLRAMQFAMARQRLMVQMRTRRSTDTLSPAGEGSTEPLTPLRPGMPRLPLSAVIDPPTTVTGRISAGDRTATTTTTFRLSGGLGSGGMSDVLLAHQVNLDRDVAVKVIKAGHDRSQLERFQAEARVTAALEHPGIVPVYDLGETFFTMRRVQGTTLAKLIEFRSGDDELPYFVEILMKVCDAVSYAHSRGVIHRDIKPENIMVGDFGQVLVLDWGLALSLHPDADKRMLAPPIPSDPRAVCAGTLGFLPPEIATGRPDQVGIGTDVFLMGATLYCVLTGDSPYDGSNQYACLHAAAATRYAAATTINPLAPSPLVELQRKAMGADPTKRGTMGDFARELRAWLIKR